MAVQESEQLENSLERIWEMNREHLRRLLIGMARDIDIADDLLQETYLRAWSGISGYRGANARAWLAAIAKNVFLAHARRRYVNAETPLDIDAHSDHHAPTGSREHLAFVAVRQAISNLAPSLRTALIMKHYGGFTYQEIAGHMRCPVGTAKWRVSVAIGKLRAALGPTEERAKMRCADLRRSRVLDYLYGALPRGEAEVAKGHLDGCPACRNRVEEVRRVVTALDELESEYKMMHIVELDELGEPTLYVVSSCVNTSDQPQLSVTFNAEKDYALDYLAAQDEELTFDKEQSPDCDHRFRYTAPLSHPVIPGDAVNILNIFRPLAGAAARELEDGTWAFEWRQCPSKDLEFAYVQAIRLPAGARFVSADPAQMETRSNGTTTLLWRRVLLPGEQFECALHYQLGR